MSINANQLRSLVHRVCARRHLDSPAATELILLTIAQESDGGTYIRQLDGGPALGVCQMERPTFDWVKDRMIPKHAELSRIVFPMLEWDMDAAIFLCRLRYKMDPEPLPPVDDIHGLASYYKRIWNSEAGKATVAGAIEKYQKFILA